MVKTHPESRVFEHGRLAPSWPTVGPDGGVQVVCIDCGTVEALRGQQCDDINKWTCAPCITRRSVEDRAYIDQQGIRRCDRCKKQLARLNFGPQCFACDLAAPLAHDDARREINDRTRQLVMARRAEGARMRDMIREFGIPESTLRNILKGYRSPELVARNERIHADFVAGSTRPELAERYGLSISGIWRILEEHGETTSNASRDERNAKIRAERAAGVLPPELAAKYGIKVEQIDRILASDEVSMSQKLRDRNRRMRVEWMAGASVERLSEKYKLSYKRVAVILETDDA